MQRVPLPLYRNVSYCKQILKCNWNVNVCRRYSTYISLYWECKSEMSSTSTCPLSCFTMLHPDLWKVLSTKLSEASRSSIVRVTNIQPKSTINHTIINTWLLMLLIRLINTYRCKSFMNLTGEMPGLQVLLGWRLISWLMVSLFNGISNTSLIPHCQKPSHFAIIVAEENNILCPVCRACPANDDFSSWLSSNVSLCYLQYSMTDHTVCAI